MAENRSVGLQLSGRTVRRMNKHIARFAAVSILSGASLLPATALAATKVPVRKVGATCTKSGASGKTAKGSALVCKRTGTKLKWALAPKKSADTTVPKSKTADSTVPKAKSADTTVPKKA